ncbi:hypothetical protein A2U01_0027665, partial [Trifolium medium]|nr:hypothetical protein [Trifolium medium]
DNYENWSCLVRNYLLGHDLWDVVAPSVSEIGAQSRLEAERWNMKNAKALHIIQLACGGSETLTHIRDFHTAKEVWDYFLAKYTKLNDSDIEQACSSVESLPNPTKFEGLISAIERRGY